MHVYPLLSALVYHRITDVGWSSSGGRHEVVAYNFRTRAVDSYVADGHVLVKQQNNMYVPMILVLALVDDVSWLPNFGS